MRLALGGALGTGVGCAIGCYLLQQKPRWSLAEDQDRLLTLLLPLAVLVECVAAFRKVPRWLACGLRLLLAASAAPILLHNSRYITDQAGPGTRDWSTWTIVEVLGGLGLLLSAAWASLGLLMHRAPGRSVPLALALLGFSAGMTIMLSGYLSAGELGLPLAAALVGIVLASFVCSPLPALTAPLGVGVVALFGLLVIGRFFGSLTTSHALLLFAAPQLCWLPELPYLRKLRPSWRGLAARLRAHSGRAGALSGQGSVRPGFAGQLFE